MILRPVYEFRHRGEADEPIAEAWLLAPRVLVLDEPVTLSWEWATALTRIIHTQSGKWCSSAV
jgi:hypothetical protein